MCVSVRGIRNSDEASLEPYVVTVSIAFASVWKLIGHGGYYATRSASEGRSDNINTTII
jgi:hypothetical protein